MFMSMTFRKGIKPLENKLELIGLFPLFFATSKSPTNISCRGLACRQLRKIALRPANNLSLVCRIGYRFIYMRPSTISKIIQTEFLGQFIRAKISHGLNRPRKLVFILQGPVV